MDASVVFPTFLKLAGRKVVMVGGGPVAAGKRDALIDAGAAVTVVAPEISPEIRARSVALVARAFAPTDLDGAWFVVAAAGAGVNRQVAAAAEERRIFVNAVDDVNSASAYAAGIVRRDGVVVAISTGGRAPALAGLLREGIDAILPGDGDLASWLAEAAPLRAAWRDARVPMEHRRPLLLEAINRLYADRREAKTAAVRSTGMVSLVGSGPGDPDLLTVRATRCLQQADLVLYDALSSPAARALAPQARWFYVGKRAGRESLRQQTINRLLIRQARRGLRVVRLKCGDPFVLGRGAEEALALAEAGIPFEVVPGLSSAIAAPALAGIPVTHRGLAAGFAVVSGHAEESFGPALDSIPPGGMTIVVLMGLGHRAAIAARLLRRGHSPATPAAVILGAATPHQHRWLGTLAELGIMTIPENHHEAPGTLVIGEVVSLAETISASSGAEEIVQSAGGAAAR